MHDRYCSIKRMNGGHFLVEDVTRSMEYICDNFGELVILLKAHFDVVEEVEENGQIPLPFEIKVNPC